MYYGYYSINDYHLYIEANDVAITKVRITDKVQDEKLNDIIIELKSQFDLYFNNQIQNIDINYEINYLEWRKKLYKHIISVEYGQTVQIKSLLKLMNLQKGVRAIAKAMNDNPLLIIIPCHRINSPVRKLKAHSYDDQFRQLLLKVEQQN